ncbi:MAG TPA: ribonuclease HII [Patescibacteria group bacterium]|nr:ribonuclease HII [Patescibacteria group bacterium]
MAKKTSPTFNEEQQCWYKGYKFVAGIDEVGRGAFAGPLVTAAVIFRPRATFQDNDLWRVNDSKLLTPSQREKLAVKIKKEALCFAIAEIPVNYINRYGVGKAAQLGFYQVATTLCHRPDFCLIDAFLIKKLKRISQKALIHGDSLSYSIAAASILAKVYRDGLMRDLETQDPRYGFARHKGYGTQLHQQKLQQHGLSIFHRTSFDLSSFLTQPSSSE